MWDKINKPATLSKQDKEVLSSRVNQYIKLNKRLYEKINRIEIKAGRIYLYNLYEPNTNPEYGTFIGKLIDGKYMEEILGRITLYDTEGKNCSIDWKRHNDKWMELGKSPLEGCIEFMNENEQWF